VYAAIDTSNCFNSFYLAKKPLKRLPICSALTPGRSRVLMEKPNYTQRRLARRLLDLMALLHESRIKRTFFVKEEFEK
jgi:hypothetical protein